MEATIRRSAKNNKLYLIYAGKATRLDPKGSPAFESGSSERISVEEARRLYGRTYAAYVWACLIVAPECPIYHAWTGVLNALGHTGDHQPAWSWRDAASIAWTDEIIAREEIDPVPSLVPASTPPMAIPEPPVLAPIDCWTAQATLHSKAAPTWSSPVCYGATREAAKDAAFAACLAEAKRRCPPWRIDDQARFEKMRIVTESAWITTDGTRRDSRTSAEEGMFMLGR